MKKVVWNIHFPKSLLPSNANPHPVIRRKHMPSFRHLKWISAVSFLLSICLLFSGCRSNDSLSPSECTAQILKQQPFPALSELSASALPSYFEFQDADVKRFSAWVSADGESADTVAAFEVTDKSGHNKVVSGISSYLTKLTSSFKNTMDSEYQKIQNRILVEDDHIVLLVICDNAGALEPLLNEWQVSPIY